MKLNIVAILCFVLVLIGACSKDAANVAIPQETGTPLTGDAAWLVGSWKVTAGWEGTVDSVYAGLYSETPGIKDTLVNGTMMLIYKAFGYVDSVSNYGTVISEPFLKSKNIPTNKLTYLGSDTAYMKNNRLILDATGKFISIGDTDWKK